MQVEEESHATKNRNTPRKNGWNSTYANKETEVQFEKFAVRMTFTVLDLRSNEQRIKLLENN